MKKLNAIIIDDEEDARLLMRRFVESYCSEVNVLDTYASPLLALDYIKQNSESIDLLYLDISMPQMNGIDFLKACTNFNLQVIFVTAHSQYAIQALRLSALDYILKPIDIDALINATEKAYQLQLNKFENRNKLNSFINNEVLDNLDKKIAISLGKEIEFVTLKDIIYLSADGNYTYIFIKGGKKMTVVERLGYFEELLNNASFERVHRSFIINMHAIQKMNKSRNIILTMINGDEVMVSQRNKDEFLEKLENL